MLQKTGKKAARTQSFSDPLSPVLARHFECLYLPMATQITGTIFTGTQGSIAAADKEKDNEDDTYPDYGLVFLESGSS